MATVNSYTVEMPTPDKTSIDAIVRAARDLLEENGLARLTMQAVAEAVGVRPPSLYKRVESRDVLIRLVAEATLEDLAQRLEATPDPLQLANAFRAFGHERPAAFQLVMTPGPGILAPRLEYGAAASRPVLRVAQELAGTDHALEAARTLTAWAAGFVSMELNQGFNLGGSIDEAWSFGVDRILAAVTISGTSGTPRSTFSRA
jgi:AcrR family transcriptional regulator